MSDPESQSDFATKKKGKFEGLEVDSHNNNMNA
jgi:hypothetical protein